MRTLRDQVQEGSDLNKTLKLELSVYEKLENTENQGENTWYHTHRMPPTHLLFHQSPYSLLKSCHHKRKYNYVFMQKIF